jgi:hypothetical protein
MARQRFTATLEAADRGGGRWVAVPFDARAEFGEARAPVAGTVNGVAFRSRLAVYGGRTLLGLTRAVRAAAAIELGDPVEVVIERDDAARTVDVPAELGAALDRDAAARAAFESLGFTHRREYARWIAEAKREDTRRRRTARAIQLLRQGVRTPG